MNSQPHCAFFARALPEVDYGVDDAGNVIKRHFLAKYHPELNNTGSRIVIIYVHLSLIEPKTSTRDTFLELVRVAGADMVAGLQAFFANAFPQKVLRVVPCTTLCCN